MIKAGTYTVILLILIQMTLNAQTEDHTRRLDSLQLVLATNPPEGADLIIIYNDLAWGYLGYSGEKTRYYSRKGISLAEQANYQRILSLLYSCAGLSYYGESQYDSAMYCYEKGLEAAERMKTVKSSSGKPFTELDIDWRKADLYGDMGNLFNIQGKCHEAIAYYLKALNLFEKHDLKKMQTLVYSNIGEMHLVIGNPEQAEMNFIKADALAQELNDSLQMAMVKWHLSHLYLKMKDYGKALQNAELAYRFYSSYPEGYFQKATTLNLFSEIYLEGHHDVQRAEAYAHEALALLDKTDTPREKAISLRLLSTVYLKRGQWRKAEQTALEAIAADDSEPANTLALYNILTKVYARMGNSEKVWEFLDKHNALQTLWSNKHYQSAIREMEVKYETEKKEHEIERQQGVIDRQNMQRRLLAAVACVLLLGLAAALLLWLWTVQKRRLAEQQIKQLEQEKQLIATQAVLDGEIQERTRIARDLHDGLGSILAGTKLNLQEMKKGVMMDHISKERFDAAIVLLDESVVEMRRVAHHLMPETLSGAGLKQSLADFCNSIPGATFNYYGDETRFDPKREAMLYRVAHELVTNALKHSGATHILVQIVKEANIIALTVQDNGSGFDPTNISKGMGLNNIRNRVAAFNGNLMVDAKPDVGTEVNVELRTAKPSTQSIMNYEL